MTVKRPPKSTAKPPATSPAKSKATAKSPAKATRPKTSGPTRKPAATKAPTKVRPPHAAAARAAAAAAGTKRAAPDWLSRAMARAGVMPLEEAERAIRGGEVTLDGRPVSQPMTLVREGAVVRVRGHRVVLGGRETRVLVYHKPPDCLTSTVRQRNVPTVFELLMPGLPSELARFHWHAVGRLDKDTTGLLLFTNDERLVTFATDPASMIPKRYVAVVQGGAEEAKVEPLRHGLQLEDGPTRPAKVVIRDPRTVEVTLTEGRHHQVKRLLGAVGLPVNALHREAVAKLELDVPLGDWRELTPEEIRDVLGFVG